ncbi:MAG: hypothetical protein GY758_06105 [Fuerstiella sp.]|jgi:osmotically-inducible protein OsmY|nr:hypothetical protein [Fuerstiella sp.]MCP4512551.1 hypothetical protein [Fuerstiella sp.]MDG2127245.1 BON domain-containing protein [Fuerstiella sp.]
MAKPISSTGAESLLQKPHLLETQVHRELLSDTHLDFSSLVIRRIPNGVCLQGVVEIDDPKADVSGSAMRVKGVGNVQNRLVMHHKAK